MQTVESVMENALASGAFESRHEADAVLEDIREPRPPAVTEAARTVLETAIDLPVQPTILSRTPEGVAFLRAVTRWRRTVEATTVEAMLAAI